MTARRTPIIAVAALVAVALVSTASAQDVAAGAASRVDAQQVKRLEQKARRASAWWAALADRGWLGVQLATKPQAESAWADRNMPEVWMQVMNLAWLAEEWDGEGAMVLHVFPESPAERAGLLPGDVIVSFNGIRTPSAGVLSFVVQRAVAGHDGTIDVLRNDESRELLVEIGLHPEDKRRIEAEKEAAERAASEAEADDTERQDR